MSNIDDRNPLEDLSGYETDTVSNTAYPDKNRNVKNEAENELHESRLNEILPVPRISIHFFCQDVKTAEIAARSTKDRRLKRASSRIFRGDIKTAIEFYENNSSPSLIFIEIIECNDDFFSNLEKLSTFCDENTKLILTGKSNDIHFYRKLMSYGASEYLIQPIGVIQLIRSISHLYTDPAVPFVGRTVCFFGAKGGVGSSSLAHNVAYLLAENCELNTTVIDYDVAFGTVGLNFNQDSTQNIYSVLMQSEKVTPNLFDHVTVHYTERLGLITAPTSLDETYNISPDTFEDILYHLRCVTPMVVLDLPHIWDQHTKQILLNCEEVVIVSTPDLASLRNAKNILEFVRRKRPNDEPPRLVINQVGLPSRMEISPKEFAKVVEMEPNLVVPFDAKLFGEATSLGKMFMEFAPKAKIIENLLDFSRTLARRQNLPTVNRPKFRFMQMLMRH